MGYATYSEIEYAIESVLPFKGNSASGVLIEGSLEVISYNTLIAAISKETGEVWYFNRDTYSNTTTRLQNIIARYILKRHLASLGDGGADFEL